MKKNKEKLEDLRKEIGLKFLEFEKIMEMELELELEEKEEEEKTE